MCYGARMVAAMERLLLPLAAAAGGAVTLHHRKIIMKDRTSGGAGALAAGAADGAGRPVPSLWPVGFRHFLARMFDSYPLLKQSAAKAFSNRPSICAEGKRGGGYGGGNRFAWHQVLPFLSASLAPRRL